MTDQPSTPARTPPVLLRMSTVNFCLLSETGPRDVVGGQVLLDVLAEVLALSTALAEARETLEKVKRDIDNMWIDAHVYPHLKLHKHHVDRLRALRRTLRLTATWEVR